MTIKRKRDDIFSAHEKLVHKSCSLLQREAKKVRTFLVRKVVQQLKQLRLQLEEPVPDAVKQRTREQKLRNNIDKFEREHAALKALELQKLVARARVATELDKLETYTETQNEHEKAPHEWDEEGSDSEEENSNESRDYKQDTDGELKHNMEEEQGGAKQQAIGVREMVEQDTKLEEKLMDRILAHKRIVPVLDAIKQLVEKEEKETEKKRRAQEKRAMKRGRHESLVGNTGRSGVVPSSLFLGSLSGRGEADVDLNMGMGGNAIMDGADDDIAEFLGEKKKRKNRPGQMARRMKAIRKEESFQRKEDRAKGIFVPYKIDSSAVSKYGPSERPKKAKSKAKPNKGDTHRPRSGKLRTASKERTPQTQKQRVSHASNALVETAHPSWLAKQKQKEKEKVSLTAFSGKKITFS
ncbi:hypothetical protein DD237_007542 [Peronospora effusa]|uniref:Bud22 domain-containing protein n=1 Tax=Peronospora effusa TaxID=542832 RepID=A0A3R7W2Y6_9STRA|nr:hypothetical protein DD237_007542 [Peronospora effusa]